MTPPKPFTPGMISRHDQEMAALDEVLDGFLESLRGQVEEFGEHQATANVALMMRDYATPGQKDELLLAALMRLMRLARQR